MQKTAVAADKGSFPISNRVQRGVDPSMPRWHTYPSMLNQQFKLIARPHGFPKPTDWKLDTAFLHSPAEGELLLKTRYLSIDPAMRSWMGDSPGTLAPIGLGEVMRAYALSEVIASRHPDYVPGEIVSGMTGVQTCLISRGEGLRRVDAKLAPLPKHLSVLGISGLTAYFGLLEVAQAHNKTVVVSAATGSVGSIVGQLAKLHGCRVVGIAGGVEKCMYAVNMLGFNACVDYRQSAFSSNLERECEGGAEVFFDNVGGHILDTVLMRLKPRAHIVLCGAISQYNNVHPAHGLRNYQHVLSQRAKVEGFSVSDYADRYDEALPHLHRWMSAGSINTQEHIIDGIENFPDTLMKLFGGENRGKLMIRVAD